MMKTAHIATIIKVAILLAVHLLAGCAVGNLSPEQQAEVDRMLISSYELPGHARRVFLTPAGMLEVETTDSQDDYEKGIGQRTLIDLSSMKRIWSGKLQAGYLVADTPSPIVVEKRDGKHRLVRYSRQGTPLWETGVGGLFLFGLAVDESNMLSLALRKTADESVHAVIEGLGIGDGKSRWQQDLGPVSFGDTGVGSLWRYHNRPVFAYRDIVYLLLEDRAIRISATTGKIHSDWKIPLRREARSAGGTLWVPYGNGVIVLSGSSIISMSGRDGGEWTATIGEGYLATEALVSGQDLIVAFSGESERGIGVLDLASRDWRWKKLEEAAAGAGPQGLVMASGAIAIASNSRLYGYDAKTGTRLYSVDLSKRDLQRLVPQGSNIVLIGRETIEARDLLGGKVVWFKDNIGTPLALYYSKRASSMASIQASLQASAAIAANSSRYYYGMANNKIGGSYAYDTWSRSQYTRLSNSAARSAAASEFASSLAGGARGSSSFIDRMVSVIVDMQGTGAVEDWAYFLIPLQAGFIDYETNTAKLLAVRLADGFSYEIPVRAASPNCIPAAMASEKLGLIVEAYHKFPFCNRDNAIDILRLPPAPR